MSKPEKHKDLYEQLVHSHAANLYRFAVRMCGHQELAEDLIQETFYEAWKSIGSLRDASKGKAWLYQILRHSYSHWVRKEKRSPHDHVAEASLDYMPNPSNEDPVENFIEHQMLQKALDRLNEIYKEPFLMVYLIGFTCQETAMILDLPLGTVLSRIHRARLYLRQFLTNDDSYNNPVKQQNFPPNTQQRNIPGS